MTTHTINISTSALFDYVGRLYEHTTLSGFNHIDVEGAHIAIVQDGARSTKIELTPAALADWIDDMEYQIEFNEGSYRSLCRRTLARLKEVQA